MAAYVTDYFQKVGWSTATTMSAPGYTVGATTINVGSTTNWPSDTGITFGVDTIDSSGQRVSGSYNVFRGTVTSATQLSDVTYVGGDANQNYSAGTTTRVYILVSSYRDNRFTDGILVEHNQDGTHDEALITSRTADTTPASGDYLLTSDVSASNALKKVTVANLWANPAYTVSTPPVTGWLSGLLPSVSSVTNNGNRSYDVTFGSTVASYLTPGMRLRTTRTVSSPTQCTSLNGTTQYYNKTSPNKCTFTDDYVAGAWVKLSSYPSASGTIISRYNGTSGWTLTVTSAGQVQIAGFNGGGGNYSIAVSNQSVPLNRWVHIASQLDMSAFTATTTTSYVMLDGVDVPTFVTRAGTNPTALVQAGDLNIGAANSTSFFPGKIAQAFFTTAKVTQAQIRSEYMCQSISASATNLGSAYSFNNSITDINTTTPNDLTAQGSAVATNADSPFSVDATGTPGGSYDFAIVTKVATTTATVQVPEGCTIPTSGGVSAVDLSSVKVPFGFPAQRGKWRLEMVNKTDATQSAPTNNVWYNLSSQSLNIPTGEWRVETQGNMQNVRVGAATLSLYTTLSTANNTESDLDFTAYEYTTGAQTEFATPFSKNKDISLSSATTYYLNTKTANTTTAIYNRGAVGTTKIMAELSTL